MDAKLEIINGKYDISFEGGDIKKTAGLDTAILTSVFCNKRARPDEVVDPMRREGHFSTVISDFEGFELGSKVWLISAQALTTEAKAAEIGREVQNCLQWMIDDNIASNIAIETRIVDASTIEVNAIISPSDDPNSQFSYSFKVTFS